MPNYDFVDEAGERHVHYFEISEAPDYDVWMEIEGRRVKRVPSVPNRPAVPNKACIIRSLPRHHPDYPRTDAMGHGVILNKREHDEFKAKQEGRIDWD